MQENESKSDTKEIEDETKSKEEKKHHKKSGSLKVKKSKDKEKSSKSKLVHDEQPSSQETADKTEEPAKVPSILQRTTFTMPKQDEIIITSSSQLSIEHKAYNGDIFVTYQSFRFITKQARPPFMVEIYWKDISQISRQHKKGYEKSMSISTPSDTISFSSIKDRDNIYILSRFIFANVQKSAQTCGFISKGDDTEAVQKINVFRAPHVLEDVVTTNLNQIIEKMRTEDLIQNMFFECGCEDFVASQWQKTRSKNGISRNVQYTQPMLQSASVSSVQTIMRSGQTFVFETNSIFSRPTSPQFLEVNSQFMFKEDGEAVSFRGAFALDFSSEVWDKEFCEETITRMERMSFYYLKATLCGEKFNEAKYEGKWRLHQPYVLVIIALAILILTIIIFPVDTNWYKILAAFIVLGGLFYF